MNSQTCSCCGATLRLTVMDFGSLPIANALVLEDDVAEPVPRYPLHAMYCEACSLVQLAEKLPADAHFHSDYVYFSSHSRSWLAHCEQFASQISAQLGLEPGDQVLEVASNDGYLLQFFQREGLDVLGVEPSSNVALAATSRGISTRVAFFGEELACQLLDEGVRPKLIVANNVLAHVPELHDFVAGFARLLHDDAVLTAEVHYFLDLFEKNQFDAFYHEHYYYYTIAAAIEAFVQHGLRVYDAERLPTHGGSVRFYVCRQEASHESTPRLQEHLRVEGAILADLPEQLPEFRQRIERVCEEMRAYLRGAKEEGRTVVGYGAPAKAATILNFASITPDFLSFTVDRNPQKQGRLLPGVSIPIRHPDALRGEGIDVVAILAWNLKQEIIASCREDYGWHGEMIVFVPVLEQVDTQHDG